MPNSSDFNNLDELEKLQQQLNSLQDRYLKLKENLKHTTDEEDILSYEFEMKKLKNEDIPNIQNKINTLIKKQRKDDEKEKLFKELYVKLDNTVLRELCNYFSLTDPSIANNLKTIVYNYPIKEIFKTITKIENELIKEAARKELYNKLYASLTDHEISLFANEYPIPCIRPKVINYLVDNFSEDEIIRILTKLYEQEKKDNKEPQDMDEAEKKEDMESNKEDMNSNKEELDEFEKNNEYQNIMQKLTRCPKCHHMIHKSVKKCPVCGHKFNSKKFIKISKNSKSKRKPLVNTKRCPECNAYLSILVKKCPYCNYTFETKPKNDETKRKENTKTKNDVPKENKKRKENTMEKLIKLYGVQFCPKCNKELPKIANECHVCGTKLTK